MADEFDFLSTIKLILGISDDSQDEILNFYFELIYNKILNYCNLSELPSALNYTLCQMVVDVYRENLNKNTKGAIIGTVSSISEDGRSVSFTNGQEVNASIDNKISNLKELSKYKKLYRI